MKNSQSSSTTASARKFGVVMALALAAFAVLSHLRAHPPARDISLVLMLLLGGLALVRPAVLIPLERIWMKVGDLMGRVMQPIVLGFIYFVLITPVAFVGRLFGRDPLHMRRSDKASHWIVRETPAIDPESFKHPY